MTGAVPSLKNRALRLLTRREYSRHELEQRLQRFAPDPGVLAAVLDELQALGFIDAQRVLESVLQRRAPRLGAARIRQELQAKGLDADLVRQALAQLHGTELERAQAVWQKKFGQVASNPAERARQMRFLASRGFASETIWRVIGAAARDDAH